MTIKTKPLQFSFLVFFDAFFKKIAQCQRVLFKAQLGHDIHKKINYIIN